MYVIYVYLYNVIETLLTFKIELFGTFLMVVSCRVLIRLRMNQHSNTSFDSGLFDLGFKLVVVFAIEMKRKVNPVRMR